MCWRSFAVSGVENVEHERPDLFVALCVPGRTHAYCRRFPPLAVAAGAYLRF